jgi:predicted transcriptional regulator YheO
LSTKTCIMDHSIVIPVLTEVIVSLLIFTGGFVIGKYRERKKLKGKNLDEYDFYPFDMDRNNIPQFNIKDFRLGLYSFLKHKDHTAARQLIFIGEQNNVRNQLDSKDLAEYEKFYKMYGGEKITDDTNEFLQNFRDIVRLIGSSFPDCGIEILLHNLANPSRSLVELENNVTGRKIGNGTTSLVLDLKTRKLLKADKLNYELNIGARKFKCTTIPIYHKSYGLLAAVCINIDVNYITDEVMGSQENIKKFFTSFCKTDMLLEENILSKEECEKALKGKRHWKQAI